MTITLSAVPASSTVPRSPTAIKTAIALVLLCDTVLSQFGFDIGVYSINFCLIAEYLLLALMLVSGSFRVDRFSLTAYGLCVALSIISYLFNKDTASSSSMFLLLTLYFPFIFTLSPRLDVQALWQWTMRAFVNIALCLAIAGIAQFFLQLIIHDRWLLNFMSYRPTNGTSSDSRIPSFPSAIFINRTVFLWPSLQVFPNLWRWPWCANGIWARDTGAWRCAGWACCCPIREPEY